MLRYALCETPDDVEYIKQSCDVTQLKWIALSSQCIPCLMKYQFEYYPITLYANGKSLFHEVSPRSEQIQKKIIIETDLWVQNQHKDFSALKLPLLSFFTYYLTILFDGVCMRIYYLSKLLSNIDGEEIIICTRNEDHDPCPTGFPWKHEETVWADCAAYLARSRYPQISLNILKRPAIKSRNFGKHSLLAQIQKKLPRMYSFFREVKHEGIRKAIQSLTRKNLLMLDANQWNYAIPELFRLGYHVIPHPYQRNNKGTTIIDNYVQQIGLSKHMRFMDIDLTPLVEWHINRCIGYGLANFPLIFRDAQRLLKSIKPLAVLFSACIDADKWVFLKAARDMGCLIFCWGHGASGQASFTKQHRCELVVCDHYFTQGLGSQSTYEKYRDYHFEVRPIGFPMLDALRAKVNSTLLSEKSFAFLYAPTNPYKNNFYFSFYPPLVDIEIYYAQKKIVDFLSSTQGESLLKIGLGNSYKDYFYEAFGAQIDIESAMPLTEMLSQTEAFILDLPTTTLLEVLCTDKPVFVLTQFIKLTDLAENLLRKRAVCAGTADELIGALEEYQKTGTYPADVTNQEYLCAFGTYLNDGKSAERGAQAVVQVISSQKRIIKRGSKKRLPL